MHDDERPRETAQEAAYPAPRGGRHAEGEAFVACAAAHRGGQIKLPAHFVPDQRRGLRVGNPVGEELVRVLMAMRKAARDAGEVAQIRRG